MKCPCCLKNIFLKKNFLSSKYGNRDINYCNYCGHNIDLTTYNNETNIKQGGIPGYASKNKDSLMDFITKKKFFLIHMINNLKKLGMKKKTSELNFMDFGCGGGEVVFAGKDIFKTSHGLNLTTDYYKYNLNLLKIKDPEISSLVVDSIEKTNIIYDLVISWHVVEHFKNPQEFVNIIKKILNGYLFIQVPTLVDNGIAPNHYNYFNDKSIKILFEKNGFITVKCYYDIKTKHLNYIAKFIN